MKLGKRKSSAEPDLRCFCDVVEPLFRDTDCDATPTGSKLSAEPDLRCFCDVVEPLFRDTDCDATPTGSKLIAPDSHFQ